MSRRTRELAAARVAEQQKQDSKQAKRRSIRNGVFGLLIVALVGSMAYGYTTYISKPVPADRVATWDTSAVVPSDVTYGDPKAPVRITEYASLSCSYCKNFHENHFNEFKREYVDSGKVFFVYRHFPYDRAALAGASVVACLPPAERPAAIDSLMDDQRSWALSTDPTGGALNALDLPAERLSSLTSCVLSEQTQREIGNLSMEASQKGIDSTPTFVVQGKVYSGFMGASALGTLVDQAINSPGE